MKNKQFKTEQLSTQTFSPDKIRSKSHQNFSTNLLPVEKFNVLLKCLLPYTYLIAHPKKYMGSGIQTTVKANELSSVMTVFVNGFHNDVMTCMLQIG